jgi:hypothetical protein
VVRVAPGLAAPYALAHAMLHHAGGHWNQPNYGLSNDMWYYNVNNNLWNCESAL